MNKRPDPLKSIRVVIGNDFDKNPAIRAPKGIVETKKLSIMEDTLPSISLEIEICI